MVHRFRLLTLLSLAVALIALGIISSSGAADATGPSRTDVIIGFKEQPGAAEQALVRQAGGTIKYAYNLVPAIAANVPETAIAGLQANPNVTNVDLDIEVHAVDAELDNTWGVKRIGAGAVHDGGNKGTGVKVAVIDSGVDYTHPDLNDNFDLTATDRCTGGLGHDFVNGDSDPMDDNGHGTHVAGTVAAEDNGSGVVGVAPEACLYALKVLGSNGSGSYSNVIAALQWAMDHGMQVTNNSYGSTGNPGSTVKAAFDNSAAAGILHAAAAGNSGNCGGNNDTVIYPARWDSLIAVAATNSNDSRPCFSSTGPDVELAAPGVSVNSTLLGGGYGTKSGTSMASPHVAGSAALVIAAGVSDSNGNGRINDEARQVLNSTAQDLGDAGRDTKYGYGLVRPDQAVAGLTPTPTGSIAGTVTNASDGTAIAGATVSADTGQSATTAADGTYAISDVPTGDRTVTASADGFDSASQIVTVSENAATTADFALTPPTTGSIAGTVTNASDGTAIAGATVSADTGQSATTAADGTYAISDVPTGDRTVTASADGFDSQTKPATVTENQTTNVDFALSPTPSSGALNVAVSTDAPSYSAGDFVYITVVVTDASGNPVSDAAVHLDVKSPDGSLYASGDGTTNGDGTVVFRLKLHPQFTPAGTYTAEATASKSGFDPGSGSTTFQVQ